MLGPDNLLSDAAATGVASAIPKGSLAAEEGCAGNAAAADLTSSGCFLPRPLLLGLETLPLDAAAAAVASPAGLEAAAASAAVPLFSLKAAAGGSCTGFARFMLSFSSDAAPASCILASCPFLGFEAGLLLAAGWAPAAASFASPAWSCRGLPGMMALLAAPERMGSFRPLLCGEGSPPCSEAGPA